MREVFEALDGRLVPSSVLNEFRKKRGVESVSKRGKEECIDPYAFALMLTIAYRMKDNKRDEKPNGICFGSVEQLAVLTRMGASKFRGARAILMGLGLVDYKKNDGLLKNVYRINWDALHRLKTVASDYDTEGEEDPDGNAAEKERNTLEEERNTLKEERNACKKARNTYPYIHKDITKDITNNMTRGGGDDAIVSLVCAYIARALGVPLDDVGKPGVRKCVFGKSPDAVKACIDAFAAKHARSRRNRGFQNPVGALVNALKGIALPTEAAVTYAEADYACMAFLPEEVKAAADNDATEKAVDGLWTAFEKAFRPDAWPNALYADLRDAFRRALGSGRRKPDAAYNIVKTRLAEDIKATPASDSDLAAALSQRFAAPEDQCAAIMKVLETLT